MNDNFFFCLVHSGVLIDQPAEISPRCCSSVLYREQIDHEYNHQEVTGQEIEFCTLVQLFVFPSLRVLSGGHPLDYLLHRPSAHTLVLHTNKSRGFGTSGTEIGPQERRQAGTVDRHAACRFPWQIRSLKESRAEGGAWLILEVSRGQLLHYHPSLGPSIVVQVHLISRH